MKRFFCSFLLMGTALTGSANLFMPRGKLTIKVIDEEGNPVSNAHASAVWSYPKSGNLWDGYATKSEKGKVSKDGTFTSSMSGYNDVTLHARCEGYYRSVDVYEFSGTEYNRYQPWNPTIPILLREVGNPTPMYAKRFRKFAIPNLKAEYDLMKGDFLPPHGKGEVADCIISGDFDIRGESFKPGSIYESFYTIEFPGDFNGVVPLSKEKMVFASDFSWPRFSPEHGYDETLIYWSHKSETKAAPEGRGVNPREETEVRKPNAQFYFFRIRSEKNPDGTFKSALHGKLISPSRTYYYYKEKKIWFQDFTYYVNPTRNDRNMEFDTENNLFYSDQKIQMMENVWIINPRAYKNGETGVSAP